MTESRTALLLLDVQPSVLQWCPDNAEILSTLAAGVKAARSAGLLIVFVSVKLRPGHPDVSPNNRAMTTAASTGALYEDLPGTLPCDELDPRPTDVHVSKRRVGAFAGTDLELVLRSQNVGAIVIAGLTTTGAVLSTVRSAADLDLDLTVLADGCADDDHDAHQLLMDRIFPTQAAVLTVNRWIASLRTPS